MSVGSAEGGIDGLIDRLSGSPRGLVNLARTLLLPRGEHDRAFEVCERALVMAPEDAELRAMVTSLRGKLAAAWYFSMVRDEGRHALYDTALRRIVRPGDLVLDIGAGTGLFAMIAARAGAGLVVACEQNPDVARAARRVVADNGLGDRTTIITKRSESLEIGVDLPRRADVLLWDNLANNMIGDGGLRTVADARRRLLVPDAAVLPGRGELRVALACDGRPYRRRMADAAGFDLRAFNMLQRSDVPATLEDAEPRSEATTILSFDVGTADPAPPRLTKVPVTSYGGVIDGVSQWLRLHLADDIVYDTSESGVTAFGYQFHTVPPIETYAGEPLLLCGNHDGATTWFWVERPTEAA